VEDSPKSCDRGREGSWNDEGEVKWGRGRDADDSVGSDGIMLIVVGSAEAWEDNANPKTTESEKLAVGRSGNWLGRT
jgi:hypothetical protein